MSLLRNLPMPDDDTLTAAAEAALRRPDDFSASDRRLFVTHGFTFAQHRDTSVLGKSNFACILRDFYDTFGDSGSLRNRDVYLTTAMAWDVGWREALTVRILRDADDDIYPGNITAAFACAVAIKGALESDYPVYDDADFADREETDRRRTIGSNWGAVRRALWSLYQVDESTDDDRVIFDAMFAAEEERSSEPWVNVNECADAIMAARSVMS